MLNDALSSPRLSFEPLVAAHADELAGLLDPRVLAWIGGPVDVEKQRARFAHMAAGPLQTSGETWVNFAVQRQTDNRALGRVEATVHGA